VALLGLGLVPLGVGVGLLVDSKDVYEDNPNERLYNATGPDGAIAAGAVLTVVGGIIVAAASAAMIRVGAAGGVEEVDETRQSQVLQAGVGCSQSIVPIQTSVMIQVNGNAVANLSTDPEGRLEIDLAETVPFDDSEAAKVATLVVAGRPVGTIDLAPVRDRQRARVAEQQRDEERMWEQSDHERCRKNRGPVACEPVRRFLEAFPSGVHAEEARRLLEADAGATIATDPQSQQGCVQVCERACPNDPGCRNTCVERACSGKGAP
jgi:hypothetical protein